MKLKKHPLQSFQEGRAGVGKGNIKQGDFMAQAKEEEIESLFKVVPPFKVVEGGFGFTGVLLRNKVEDSIQCHICGLWKKFLAVHINKKHEMLSEEYRKKFELPLEFPLCARSVSSKKSVLSSSAKQLETLKRNRKEGLCKFDKKKFRKRMKYAANNVSFKNKHGACDEQIERRYLIVSDIVGKQASQKDIIKHDNPLWGIIYRRFKTINNFRKHYSFETVDRAKIHDQDSVIGGLRAWSEAYQRVPSIGNYSKSSNCFPSVTAIKRVMGSWHRAMLMAGFSVESRNEAAIAFRREG